MNYRAYGEVGQDLFAFEKIGQIGTFLDIGCGNHFDQNNSYGLERIGWTGVAVDRDAEILAEWPKFRKARVICAEALTIDWKRELKGYTTIDYLSIDLMDEEPEVMSALIIAGLSFRVITIEHDNTPEIRRKEREILFAAGYTLDRPNVLCPNGTPFEDWWTK
jgi:hypothetical protein